MTDDDLTTGRPECGEDVAAYALGALDATEAVAFERHLESCAACRDELLAFRHVVHALPMSAPEHSASPELRRRVLRAVADEPRRTAAGAPAAHRRSRLQRRLMPRPAAALATVAAGAVLAVVVVAVVLLSSSSPPATRVNDAQVTGHGTAQLRVTGGHGELTLQRFSPPPAGEIYEVWLKRGTAPPSPTTALFSVTADGTGDVVVPGNLRGVSLVMVTPEPAGGTRVPTHPAVLSASLT